MRRLPTASQLGRAFMCAGSEALPHILSTSEAGTRGTAVHAFIARARQVGRVAALAEIHDEAPHLALCEALPLDELPAGGDHEIAVAWDHVTDTARALAPAEHRDYADVRATEFAGTADYLGREADGVVVVDWKSGHRYLGPARESRQLRMLALAAARFVGVDQARVAYCYLREDGTYALSWATFDAFDLAEIADELRCLVNVLDEQCADGAPLQLHESDACDFCPAFNSCPAKMQLARAIGTGDALKDLATIERRIEAMTDEELARAYQAIERYDDVAKRVREAVRQRAAMHPIELGEGRRLGSIAWPFTVVKADVAYETVRELHGAATAEAACPRKATITAIRKLGDETLAEIERRRGVVTGSKPQVRVHRP